MLPKIRTILYASDLGENAPKVFAHCVALARQHGAAISFVHALEPLGPTGRSLVRNMVPHDLLEQLETEGIERVRTQIRERIDAFCQAELGSGVHAPDIVSEVRIAEGHPAEVILEAARSIEADLIILGTHTHSRLHRALIGSVAQKVIVHADRPVLLVPIPADVA